MIFPRRYKQRSGDGLNERSWIKGVARIVPLTYDSFGIISGTILAPHVQAVSRLIVAGQVKQEADRPMLLCVLKPAIGCGANTDPPRRSGMGFILAVLQCC